MTTKLGKTIKANFALLTVLLSSSMTLATIPVVQGGALPKSNVNHTNSFYIAKFVDGESIPDAPIPIDQNPTPIPTSSPIPNQNTTDKYRQQVGLSTSNEIGTTKEILAVSECSAFQGAGTFNKGVETKCPYQLPKELTDRGWVITNSRVEVVEQSKKTNRSGTRTEVLAADGYVFDYDKEVGSKINAAIKLAVEAGDIKAEQELKLEYQKHREKFRFSQASHNTFNLYAWANGGLAAKGYIKAKGYVTIEKFW